MHKDQNYLSEATVFNGLKILSHKNPAVPSDFCRKNDRSRHISHICKEGIDIRFNEDSELEAEHNANAKGVT